ncbi:hypothetical protein [Pseudomonas syringae]|uniref:hypothetical protein n=1 Tax=Pseudomonas syringae TaxID=317 RepID=UPI00136283D2|nr:hypothetical protein [Pseudomonas syringae]
MIMDLAKLSPQRQRPQKSGYFVSFCRFGVFIWPISLMNADVMRQSMSMGYAHE